MTDRAAMIAAVLANPDDDTPRLVFADWCDDNGEPERAEFLRVQVELARTGEASCWTEEMPFGTQCTDPECPWAVREQLRERERDLLDRHRLSWLDGPLMGMESQTAGEAVQFIRGFVESVTCPAADWLAHADAILAEHPVRRVRFTTWPEDGREVFRVNRRDDTATCDRWPGIAFEVPHLLWGQLAYGREERAAVAAAGRATGG